jgi:cytochrome P450
MTHTVVEQSTYPVSDVDPFSREYLVDPYPFHEQLREAGPMVWLHKWNCWGTGRYKEMNEILADPQTFCSGAGVGIANFNDEKPWRPPSLLLEADPPAHTKRRAVVGKVLSAGNLRRLRADFEVEAQALVERILEKKQVDAVREIAEPYILKVFPDAVGLDENGRENLLAYGAMVFNSFGPQNDVLRESMCGIETVRDWIMASYSREKLRPGGLGQQVYEAADSGEVTLEEAPILVRSFLSAGVDTTVNAIGNAIWCLATHPDQWKKLHANPALAPSAFVEVVRFESPFQSYFRTSTRDTSIAGVPIAGNQKVFMSVGAANRDPRRWERPNTFDIERQNAGHMGFGAGIHGCIGQMIARLETEVLFTAMARRISAIEVTGPTTPRLNNVLRGFETLPVTLHAAP